MSEFCRATIRSVGDITHVNIRAGASTSTDIIGQAAVGTFDLKVLEVKEDETGAKARDRVYQWFKLQFNDGKVGWVRDDLVEIQGDCRPYGYGLLATPTRAANLTRIPNEADLLGDQRTRMAAFAITAGFEGAGYATYQTYDAGIISYGRFQFTLASGNLVRLIERYVVTATGQTVEILKTQYLPRLRQRDPALKFDQTIRTLLTRAARDPLMQKAQDELATEAFWIIAMRSSIVPREIKTPLGQAFVFDSAIHHGNLGVERDVLRPAEQSLGVPPKSMLSKVGLTEQQLIARAAQIRRDRLYFLANTNGWNGLKPRGDFWVERVNARDWDLQGDARGYVQLRPGVMVQVREP